MRICFVSSVYQTLRGLLLIVLSPSFKMVQPATNPNSGSRKISFNVSDQYDIQDVIGEGAYGVVW